MVVGEQHPSTICVELSKLPDSLISLLDLMTSSYMDEELMEFIESYARKEEVMPDDRTVGFVVANASKKAISISMNKISPELHRRIEEISESFREKDFTVELDLT